MTVAFIITNDRTQIAAVSRANKSLNSTESRLIQTVRTNEIPLKLVIKKKIQMASFLSQFHSHTVITFHFSDWVIYRPCWI